MIPLNGEELPQDVNNLLASAIINGSGLTIDQLPTGELIIRTNLQWGVKPAEWGYGKYDNPGNFSTMG